MKRLLPVRSSLLSNDSLRPHFEYLHERSCLFASISLAALLFLATLCTSVAVLGQAADRLPQHFDSGTLAALPNHHPQWAKPANFARPLSPSQDVPALTMILSRPAEQESAFLSLLAEQQDPGSPQFHHWLTPGEIGERFGPSVRDVEAVSDWLKSQGLRVTFVSPSRIFLNFAGTAEQLEQAFHTKLQMYNLNGIERMSVSSDPLLPTAIAPIVRAIRGLYTIEDRSFHEARTMHAVSPEFTLQNGDHFLTPQDFATIYDLPALLKGSGQTVGIVGRSRTDFADFDEYQALTGTSFGYPNEIIPTALGGVDPGPAYTAPPPNGTSIDDQLEATLDVMRAGSIATQAQVDLVVATNASGGIAVSAQYLVQTTPVPVQTMNISFGDCELDAGTSGVTFWDSLFQQAAGEGISVFVSAGDAGASGCDANFQTPPSNPRPDSPNYICSSSYATCLGGTEFNDTGNPAAYWNPNNNSDLGSALNYIPEGAWNEPVDSKGVTHAASSGGGVSSLIPTPSWQKGTGVPSARTGRYTPDLAFSASGHDGYFACFAAAGASCVPDSNGEYEFEYFYGTSAAAPDMAGITALLDEQVGIAQGNLNPLLYPLAASSPSTFHDVTVATSGVSNCSLDTPSMCNNSIPGPTSLTGGQPGYLIGIGYDEVTGLGSLDVSSFIGHYLAPKTTPTITLPAGSSVTTAQPLYLNVELTGRTSDPPTGSVVISGGGYTSASMSLVNGSASYVIPADVLAVGTDTLKAAYTPDSASAGIYTSATATATVTVTAEPLIKCIVTVDPQANTIVTAQKLPLFIYMGGGTGDAAPTGTFKLTSGNYSVSVPVAPSEQTGVLIPSETLAVGTDVLTVSYTPDSTSAHIYTSSTGSATVTVSAATAIVPQVDVEPASNTVNTAQSLAVTVNVGAGILNYQAATGTVTLTAGSFSSAATVLSSGSANFNIPAGALAVGSDTLTASYVPDSASSGLFLSATGSQPLTVSAAPNPSFAVIGSAVSVSAGATTGNTSTITVAPANGFTGTVTLTAAITSSPANALYPPTVSFGSTGSVLITGTNSGTGTLTISTTAQGGCPQSNQRASTGLPLYAPGGAALASVFLLGFSRSKRRRFCALTILLCASVIGVTACGGGSKGISTCQVITSGTTAGTYSITVTGTSASLTKTGTVTLIVQ